MKSMPNLSSSLLEILTYMAPGLLVLYSMRNQFTEVENMIAAIKLSGGAAAIPLLVIALAMGVMVAGVASLLFGLLRRAPLLHKLYPQRVSWVSLFRYSGEQLQMLRYTGQTDQAYQNMSVALLISLFFVWVSLFLEHRKIENGVLMFWVNVVFAFLMTAASVRYNVRFWQFMAALAESPPPEKTKTPG